MAAYTLTRRFADGVAFLNGSGHYNEKDWRDGWQALFNDPAYVPSMPIVADFTDVRERVSGFMRSKAAIATVLDILPRTDRPLLVAVVIRDADTEEHIRTIRVVAENAPEILGVDTSLFRLKFFPDAEMAFKWVKREGPNLKVSIAAGKGPSPVKEQEIGAEDIWHGIAKNEFFLVYQPQYHLRTREMVGCEALMRWRKSDGTMIYPGSFIPLAEKTAIISHLDEVALRLALRQARTWHRKYLRAPRVGVNISAGHIAQETFVSRVLAIAAEEQADLATIDFEITEQTLLVDHATVAAKMKQLAASGCTFSIDDFGTGYSSLAYLKALPISRIKIDQIFVRDADRDSANALICDAIVKLADAFGCHSIAEGIETESSEDMLKELGCDEGQGYFFSRPAAPDELTGFIPRIAGLGRVTTRDQGETDFEARLPTEAKNILDLWRRSAANDGQKVSLDQFLEEDVPTSRHSFSMIYGDSGFGFKYTWVGKRLVDMFGQDPTGRVLFFYTGSAYERQRRVNLIEASIRTSKPFWFEGHTLFGDKSIQFGRLGLPGMSGSSKALIMIYFQIDQDAEPQLELQEEGGDYEVFWLGALGNKDCI